MLDNKSILITGGTGSFGNQFVEYAVTKYKPKKIIIYSRDEFKQFNMRNKFKKFDEILRFFIGDVREKERLIRACKNVDYIIHAAALKHVPICEYNPIEAIKTNINGAMNVIDAALDCGVSRVVALSTDKAVNPINLYGGTKLVSDKLFISANAYAGLLSTKFSIVRYGNVVGSRGSVVPFFQEIIDKKINDLPITDMRMTRFWITLKQGVDLVLKALSESKGGETYISKILSFWVKDLVQAMAPKSNIKIIGIREGEKLHEIMVTRDDSRDTWEYDKHFIIYPHFEWWDDQNIHLGGVRVSDDFQYDSYNNNDFMNVNDLKFALKSLGSIDV